MQYKQFRMGFMSFLKEQKPASLKKHLDFEKKQVGCLFFKKTRVFLNPGYLSIFFVIFPRSDDLEQVPSPPVSLGVGRTPTAQVPGIEETENYWHLNA